MSSILKALRKAEDEKATLGEGSVDLAHDILKRNYAAPKRFPWLLMVFSCCLILLLSVGVGWYLMQSPDPQTAANVRTAPRVQEKPLFVQPAEKIAPVTATVPEAPAANIAPAISQPAAVPHLSSETVSSPSEPIEIPDLRIDEIIYQDDPSASLAVINELPVMVGTDIEGARVEEILPGRVRFSFQGTSFTRFKESR